MKRWEELLDQVLLGTQGAPPPSGEFAGQPSEAALLKALALAGAARRAGYIAQTSSTSPEIDPAPPETQPACSQLALDWFQQVAEHAYTRVLVRDWALLLIRRGKRLPHPALPRLLAFCTRNSDYVPYIVPLLGERGRWVIMRSDGFVKLRQTELWSEDTHKLLKPSEIESTNPMLFDLRKQLLEALAHE
jgi:hypothetical protein